MGLNREENYKYRNASLTILAKALDDICPKFEGEPETVRNSLIKDRKKFFKQQEQLLDKEWGALDREATRELKKLNTERRAVISKIKGSKKTSKIKSKITSLELNMNNRLRYLNEKMDAEVKDLKEKALEFDESSKKYLQIQKKIDKTITSYQNKIESTKNRYKVIIDNVQSTDNSNKIEERIEHSKDVWKRKYLKLKDQFEEKESIHNTKRFEQDQVRLAVQGFVEEIPRIKHFCLMAGVPLRTCYQEVNKRLELLGRKPLDLDTLLSPYENE